MYNEFISNIIEQYGQHRKSDGSNLILERHHIIPKCLGGSDLLFNLVDLTPREHFIAHQLLAEENPSNEKLVCAWHYMAIIKKSFYQVTPEEYQLSRQAIIKAQGKSVYKLDKDGQILGVYVSCRDAGRANNVSGSHISECCNKERITIGGYYWQFVDDYDKNGFNPKKIKNNNQGYSQKVCQYNSNNELIQVFNSAGEAGRATKIDSSSIIANCRGRLKTAGGFIWKYFS